MVKILHFTALLAIGLIIMSCNAPHENPLDPENPDNILYYIEGTISSSAADSEPLQNTTVLWAPENISTISSKTGYFKIDCESMTNGWLYFETNGYSKDSLYINWSSNKHLDVDKRLNSIPVLDSIFTYSAIKNKYSLPEKQLILEVYASDLDNDIDSIIICNTALLIEKPLQKMTSKYFEGKFNDYDLNLTSIEELVGKRLELFASVGGTRFHIGNSYMRRVISSEIETLSPSNSDTLDTRNPLFIWKRFEPGFSFTYMIEIYTDETEAKLLWRKENISSAEINLEVSYTITPSIDNNRFFWVIWCIDEYKDRTRSKPAGFIVK